MTRKKSRFQSQQARVRLRVGFDFASDYSNISLKGRAPPIPGLKVGRGVASLGVGQGGATLPKGRALPTPGLGVGGGGVSLRGQALPTPGLGVGRGGTTPPKCPALLTPRLGVGRGGFSLRVGQGGATPSKGRAQPTPGLRVGLASDSAAPVSIQISLDFKAIPARTPQRDKTLPRFSCSNPS